MGRKLPTTPRSRLKNVLRQFWLRSRERAKALKDHNNCCCDCGVKQSAAKGREVKLEVHHDPAIDWSGMTDLVFERLLNVPQFPLCQDCHRKRHEQLQEKLPKSK